MFTNPYPQFLKGRILKTEMLDNLRDYPRHFNETYWSGYSNGIVSGAEVKVSGEKLIITRGIVIHHGRLYVMPDEREMAYEATGRETLIKLRFSESPLQGDFINYAADIVLDENVQLKPDEQELGRFKLKQGARLRMDYQSFADMTTEYNTVNLIHVDYAGRGKSTLAPFVMRYFGSELLKNGSTDAYDISFGMLCMNEGTVDRELIMRYLSTRMNMEQKEANNEFIHRCFVKLLNETRGGNQARSDFRRGGVQRVLVD
ncbi:DNA and RNA helicase [Cohnella terricola]|uniref:DNA and RNA helicase n=1 Tax=Cohnella terricola TaxID=1289167 RepID=A0A559J5F5_9BACL|nr:DNA and RNA helicase [Cohnella terricola]TVX95092.1 DNA and RNA helicase [Cohnella terricola]